MPDSYFKKPCPACGGRVKHQSGQNYAECESCRKKFRLIPAPQDAPPNPIPPISGKSSAKNRKESSLRRFFSAVKRQIRKVKVRAISFYGKLYVKIRKKNDRIPLPKPASKKLPKNPPAPPMNESQRALYLARKKQLESRREISSPPPPQTRGERLETFVLSHRVLSLTVSLLTLILLLVLLISGITFCVKESHINKDDFTIWYGIDGVKEKASYKFIAYKNDDRELCYRINMNALAKLCDLTISGTASQPRYAVRDGSSYVKFQIASEIATVNGKNYEMDRAAELDEHGNLWVDLAFADDIIRGLSVSVDTETNTITATRNTTSEGTVLSPVYETISIFPGNQTESDSGSSAVSLSISYKIDISAYRDALYPSGNDCLILVNKQNPLSADDVPNDLVLLTVPTTKAISLRRDAASALTAMFAEMEADGVTDIWVTSGYRSYAYQEALYNYYVEKYITEKGISYDEAVALADSDTARAGYSEHQTGLCVDFRTSEMTSLSNEFENTAASKWLRENAWKFGFILRYPSGKTDLSFPLISHVLVILFLLYL